MVERTEVSPLRAKVWLLFAHSHSFPILSRNILREICLYLGIRDLLPCLFGNTLHLYNLDTRKDTVVTLSQSFDSPWVYCNIEDKFLLAVYREALAINLNTFEISPVGTLNTDHEWPGLGWATPFVYVFGGGIEHTLTSCVKLQWGTGVWRSIGDMKGPKCCFTPCRVRDEFYLCCFEESGKPFEAFHMVTETFRDLAVTYRSPFLGSLACLVGDSLYIVGGYDDILLQWKLDQMHLEEKRLDLKGDMDLGSSNIAPIYVGRKIYWVCDFNGYLVSLDLHSDLIEVNRWGK